MSSKKQTKAKIIYNRLYKEYGGSWNTQEEFADLLGISRQGLDYRKANNKVDYDEIMELFPQVNRQWLFSKTLSKLESLPVRPRKMSPADISDVFPVNDIFTEYKDRKENEGFSENERDLLLEFLLEHAEYLSKGLRRLIEIEKGRSDEG